MPASCLTQWSARKSTATTQERYHFIPNNCIPYDGREHIFIGAWKLGKIQPRATLPVAVQRAGGGSWQQWGQSTGVCVRTTASEGAKAARREYGTPPGQLRAMLIQLLFKTIFLSDLLSNRSVFSVLLTCRVPAAAGACPAPPGTGRKAEGSKAVRSSQIKVAPSLPIVSIIDYSHR